MARIRYLCRGLICFVVLVAVLMAKARSSHGETDNSSTVRIRSKNQTEGDQQFITVVSKFDALSNLKKGDTHSGLTDLKTFLATFGYLPRHRRPPTAIFDDQLDTALRLYQSSFNLSVTGVLDRATLDILRVPRCGREDVRDGLALMLLPKLKTRSNGNGSRLPVNQMDSQQWKFMGGNTMWQTTRNLTYAFSDLPQSDILSSDDIRSAVASAFQSWAAVVPIDFKETDDFEGSNLKIEFVAGDHEDGWPFDGRLGVLSHAFPPEDGRFHLDNAEVWTVSMAVTDDRSAIDLETVALHEIGHLIGLDHSSADGSIMFPSLEARKINRQLTADDIDGATALYGIRNSRQHYEIPNHAGPREEFKKDPGYQGLPNSGHMTALVWAPFAFVFLECFLLMAVCWFNIVFLF